MASLLAPLFCSAILASGLQSGSTQQPAFRVSTELVVIDVTVIGRDGTPVKDLRADDFVVKVDNQPRRIVSLQFVDQSTRPTAAQAAASVRPLVSSNQSGGTGRLVLIVVDEATIRFGGLRAAAESVDRLLAGFGPSDRIGLATLPGPRMLVEFGRDRQRIGDAIKKISGSAEQVQNLTRHQVSVSEAFAINRSDSFVWQQVSQRECGSIRSALEQQTCVSDLQGDVLQVVRQIRNQTAEFSGGFRSLLGALRAVDAPKIVVLFSEGLISPEAPTDLAPLAYESAAARTVIYVMRLDRTMFDVTERSPIGSFFEDQSLGRASLEALAGPSRGTVFEIIGSSQIPFERLALEVSGYYLVGIEPEGTDRDGKRHRIQVEALRPGLTVRARPEFAFTPPKPAADESKVLIQTLQSPLLAVDVPIRLTTFNMADDDSSKVRVIVAAEIDRQQQKSGAALVGFAILDDQGKARVGYSQRADLEKTASGALAFVDVAAVAPGTYTLKLAAVREGRSGSVEHRFTARLTPAASLRLGDLLICDPAQSQARFMPPLDARVSGDRILGFVQLRADRDVSKDVKLVLDIVKEESGPVLMSTPLTLNVSRTSVRVAQAVLDARLLPPGDYGARLSVSVAGKPAGKLFTQFSLERRVREGTSGVPGSRAAGPPAEIVRFRREEVLAPEVVAPFLDELAAYATDAGRAAIEKAKAGKLDEAVQQLKPGSAADPTPAFIRGLALYSKGQLQPASDAFREAVRAAPDFLVGAFYIGACYAAGGREERAISAWQTSLVTLDRFPIVYRVLTDALVRAGQAERATALLDEAVARWPEDDALRVRMVKAAFEAGRYERMLEYVDRAIDRQAADAGILFLAMQAVFQAVLDTADAPVDTLLPRLRRYRDLYVAAGGPQQALVAEWVSFLETKASKRDR
jgi:VWFA-related protein